MRIIVTGGRGYSDARRIFEVLREYHRDPKPTLVHGAASGADTYAVQAAIRLGWVVEAHPADWRTHGRAAGPIRNAEMVAAGADLVIAFPGGPGTAHCVARAIAAGIPVRHVDELAPFDASPREAS